MRFLKIKYLSLVRFLNKLEDVIYLSLMDYSVLSLNEEYYLHKLKFIMLCFSRFLRIYRFSQNNPKPTPPNTTEHSNIYQYEE